MELAAWFWDLVVRLDVHLADFVQAHGVWVYGLLFLIVFCETGLVVTPFLPGDSLLFVAGAVAAAGDMNIAAVMATLIGAALCGDNVNYWVGRWIGPRPPASLIGVSSTRVAKWIIWTAYFVLAVAVAVFSYLVQSKRMDIGATMASVLLLGAVGVVTTIALLSGSVIGTTALARNPSARRACSVATVIAGWAGAAVLAWLSWSF